MHSIDDSVQSLLYSVPITPNTATEQAIWMVLPVITSSIILSDMDYFPPHEALRTLLQISAVSSVGAGGSYRRARVIVASLTLLPV